MWPHSVVIGVGDTAVCVGTDDSHLVDALAPWIIEEPAELFDYGAQLLPPPAPRGQPRALANLRHGSDWLASSPDPAPIREGLLRVLGGIADREGAGEIRLAGVPLMDGATINVAAPEEAAHASVRQLSRGGRLPLLVDGVIIDTERLLVRVSGALDGSHPPIVAPLREWRAANLDPLMNLAQVVAALAPRLRNRDTQHAVEGLRALAQLVRKLPPVAVPE